MMFWSLNSLDLASSILFLYLPSSSSAPRLAYRFSSFTSNDVIHDLLALLKMSFSSRFAIMIKFYIYQFKFAERPPDKQSWLWTIVSQAADAFFTVSHLGAGGRKTAKLMTSIRSR